MDCVSWAPVLAQENTTTVSSPSWKGLEIQFVTKVEPSGTGLNQLSSGVTDAPDRAHRYIIDTANKRYFGYDVRLDPLADPETVRLRIEPLSLPGNHFKQFGIDSGWTLLAPSKLPVIPVVHAGVQRAS